MNKIQIILLGLFLTQSAIGQDTTREFIIKEADLIIKMPNSKWTLTDYKKGKLAQYIFKRESIIDSQGGEIIPAIMVYVEDAKSYEQDVTVYAIMKQKPLMENGVKIDKILTQNDTDYPISYTNSYFYKCHYNDNGMDHILYMIFIINKDNQGIQLYMDMTQDIAGEYEKEFIEAIKSIKEHV
jgi:hypothetical protein